MKTISDYRKYLISLIKICESQHIIIKELQQILSDNQMNTKGKSKCN